MNLLFQNKEDAPQVMLKAGSVQDVIEGKIDPELKDKSFEASDYKFGFELASPYNLDSMGEAVIVNKQCYAASTKPFQVGKLICGPSFYTSGIFLIPNSARCNYEVEVTKETSLQDFYKTAFEEANHPFAFIGLLKFKTIHHTIIQSCPIEGKNIFENKDLYYPNPPKVENDVFGFVCGLVSDLNKPFRENKDLNAVLYNNPFDSQQSLTTHVHLLTLKQSVSKYTDITPEIGVGVSHLFEDNTVIDKGSIHIYKIKEIKNL